MTASTSLTACCSPVGLYTRPRKASRLVPRARLASKPEVQVAAKVAKILPVGLLIGTCYAAHVIVQAADFSAGEEVFDNNCAACHMGGGNVVAAGRTLQKAAIEEYLEGGLNEQAIITQVQNGKGAMPAWSGRLSEEEIKAVAAYLYNQSANDLWE